MFLGRTLSSEAVASWGSPYVFGSSLEARWHEYAEHTRLSDRSTLEAFGMPQLFGVAGRPNGWRAAKMAHRKRSLILLCLPPRCWSFSLGQKHVWATNTSSDGCRASLCLASNLGVVACADPFSDFCDWLFMMNQMTSCLPCSAGPVMFHPCLCLFLCAWSEHRLLAANPA